MSLELENRIKETSSNYNLDVKQLNTVSKNIYLTVNSYHVGALHLDEVLSEYSFRLSCISSRRIILTVNHFQEGEGLQGRRCMDINKPQVYEVREPVGRLSRRSSRRF